MPSLNRQFRVDLLVESDNYLDGILSDRAILEKIKIGLENEDMAVKEVLYFSKVNPNEGNI